MKLNLLYINVTTRFFKSYMCYNSIGNLLNDRVKELFLSRDIKTTDDLVGRAEDVRGEINVQDFNK